MSKLKGKQKIELKISISADILNFPLRETNLVEELRNMADKIEAAIHKEFSLENSVYLTVNLEKEVDIDISDKSNAANN